MGVRRAVDTVEGILDGTKSGAVYTMGPLIHNPVVLEGLKKKGLSVLDDENIELAGLGDTVVIRAHGVAPAVYEKLKKQECTVIDATCPRVKVSQKRASEYAAKGYTIILTGDKNHGEVTGISGFAGKNFLLLQNFAEAQKLFGQLDNKQIPEKAVLLSQTTYSPEEFEKIASLIKQKIPELEIFNTICSATRDRQSALVRLAVIADGILVIGGRNSANTQRLYSNALALCKKAALIETADEIPEEYFKMETVGITAGASTPDELIKSVEEKLNRQNCTKNGSC